MKWVLIGFGVLALGVAALVVWFLYALTKSS